MREKIFSSTPKLGRVLAAGGSLSIHGRLLPELLVADNSPGFRPLLEVGGLRFSLPYLPYRMGLWNKATPPIFAAPVHARSLDGAVHEVAAMCDDTLHARLNASTEVMAKAGFDPADYAHGLSHEGGIGKSRLIEILRQQAHLMMEWTSEELTRVAEHVLRYHNSRGWVPPNRASAAEKELMEKRTVAYAALPEPEVINTPTGCFVKVELPAGSLCGTMRIR